MTSRSVRPAATPLLPEDVCSLNRPNLGDRKAPALRDELEEHLGLLVDLRLQARVRLVSDADVRIAVRLRGAARDDEDAGSHHRVLCGEVDERCPDTYRPDARALGGDDLLCRTRDRVSGGEGHPIREGDEALAGLFGHRAEVAGQLKGAAPVTARGVNPETDRVRASRECRLGAL